MPPSSPHHRVLVVLAILVGLVSWDRLHAQGSPGDRTVEAVPDEYELAGQRAIVRQRDRSAMHPGNPLVLVGVEQGGNDLRSKTPALASVERNARPVDAEALHDEKLQLYAGSYGPLPAVSITRRATGKVVVEPPRDSAQDKPVRSSQASLRIFVAALLAVAVVGAWCLRRYKLMTSEHDAS